MSVLECSGLVTLSQFPLEDEQWVNLSKGDDYATLTDLVLYAEYAVTRKALFHTIYINDVMMSTELINSHLTPYNKVETENRKLREKQAEDICEFSKGREYRPGVPVVISILGMDMNDQKISRPFRAFKRCGFADLFNSNLKNPITFAHPDNNMVSKTEKPATLDYIMIKDNMNEMVTIKEMKMETLKTDGGISFSDHESLFATFEIFE